MYIVERKLTNEIDVDFELPESVIHYTGIVDYYVDVTEHRDRVAKGFYFFKWNEGTNF